MPPRIPPKSCCKRGQYNAIVIRSREAHSAVWCDPNQLALSLRQAGREAEALRWFQASIATLRPVVQRYRQAAFSMLIESHLKSGEILAKQRRLGESAAAYRAGLEALSRSGSRRPVPGIGRRRVSCVRRWRRRVSVSPCRGRLSPGEDVTGQRRQVPELVLPFDRFGCRPDQYYCVNNRGQ